MPWRPHFKLPISDCLRQAWLYLNLKCPDWELSPHCGSNKVEKKSQHSSPIGYGIDTPLVCKYGPQTVDLLPIMLRTLPKFG